MATGADRGAVAGVGAPGYTVAAARLIGARVGRIETARTAAAKLVDPRVASEVAVEELS